LAKATSLPPQEAIITWPPFSQYKHVFCAKKRLGHARIRPRMVTGKPVLKLYRPPKKLVFPRPKN
jgi:hypothetical protein